MNLIHFVIHKTAVNFNIPFFNDKPKISFFIDIIALIAAFHFNPQLSLININIYYIANLCKPKELAFIDEDIPWRHLQMRIISYIRLIMRNIQRMKPHLHKGSKIKRDKLHQSY